VQQGAGQEPALQAGVLARLQFGRPQVALGDLRTAALDRVADRARQQLAVDLALQMQAKYGDKLEFIHQEVYVDNDPNKGLRAPLQAFHLQTEPWLFVVGKDGRIAARLEGSFGLNAFNRAIRAGLASR